ncbi:MAG: 16S rRNA (guanine(1405)-N(7))-methyltransferase RmtF [Clostridia bacterium]
MNEQEQVWLDGLLSSKKYRDVCPDTVTRLFEDALLRYRSPREAEQAARGALHQITGAFMTVNEVKKARDCLAAYVAGDEAALARCLALHASARERPQARALFARVFEKIGAPEAVLDLACGLNPLVLGALGTKVWGCDISGSACALVNDWAKACGWLLVCERRDLLCAAQLPPGDLALMMKLLPVLERQKAGAGAALLRDVRARYKLVTFPTRTLGGRQVGMASQYAQWLTAHLGRLKIIDQFELGVELCYLLEDENG